MRERQRQIEDGLSSLPGARLAGGAEVGGGGGGSPTFIIGGGGALLEGGGGGTTIHTHTQTHRQSHTEQTQTNKHTVLGVSSTQKVVPRGTHRGKPFTQSNLSLYVIISYKYSVNSMCLVVLGLSGDIFYRNAITPFDVLPN